MNFAITFLTLLNLWGLQVANAKEMARPDSIGGDQLLEFNAGFFIEEDSSDPEIGFDYEYFIPSSNHHFSVGIATDIGFGDQHTEYYMGPLFSGYYKHFKLFWTSGVASEDFEKNVWKHRLGLGYEIMGDLVYVPSVSYDKIGEHEGMSITFGCAHEF